MTQIATLFANDITRHIEEVIKVDQTDEDIVASEVDEYVVTDAIKRHFVEILERYQDTPQKPHEGIAIWVSGFFGSGKSSFAKILGLAIENRKVLGGHIADRFLSRTRDPKLSVVLKTINEHIPTHTVIFDVSTDRGIRSGNQMLSQIMYRLFLRSLGYADDLDLSELEINLGQRGELDRFKDAFRAETGKDWDVAQGAHHVRAQRGEPNPAQDAPRDVPDGRLLGEDGGRTDGHHAGEACRSHRRTDEAAEARQVAHVRGRRGRAVRRPRHPEDARPASRRPATRRQGATASTGSSSRRRRSSTNSSADSTDRQIELARLMDRFPLQVHLEPSDISEVTSRRVSGEERRGRDRFSASCSRTTAGDSIQHTRIERGHLAARGRPTVLRRSLSAAAVPDRPHHPDRLRPADAERRQQARRRRQPHDHQARPAASDQSADQAGGRMISARWFASITSTISSRATSRPKSGRRSPRFPPRSKHRMAQAVAKVVCLLQFVKRVQPQAPRTSPPALHGRVDADSCLAEVQRGPDAELEKALLVRDAADGYRIPTPAEDDWEQTRARRSSPSGPTRTASIAEVFMGFWTPAPTFNLGDTKSLQGRVDGQRQGARRPATSPSTCRSPTTPRPPRSLARKLRVRSQSEPKSHLLGRHHRRGHPQRDARSLSLPANDREEGPRHDDGGRHRAHRRRKGPPAPAHGRVAPASEDRRPVRPGLVPRQRSQP